MNNNPNLIKSIIQTFGEDSYINGILNRDKFINLLFSDDESRLKMNSLVIPFVRKEYYDWCEIWKKEDYILFESAILFDSEDRIKTDFNILVIADLDIRIKRVIKRNGSSEENIRKRILAQSSDEYKSQFSDYVITNNGNRIELEKQIMEIHQQILTL